MPAKIIRYLVVFILILFSVLKQSNAQNASFLPKSLDTISLANANKIEQIAMFAPDGSDLTGSNSPELQDFAEEPPGSNHWITSVAFSPDGHQLVAGSYDSSARTWNLETGQHRLTLIGHKEMVNDVVFSPDGSLIASCSGEYEAHQDFSVRIWDAIKGTLLATLQGHKDEVLGIAFSPDGARIASASMDGTIRIWSVKTGEQLIIIPASDDWVRTVKFDITGRIMLTASNDNSVKLWDAESGKLIRSMPHDDWVFDARFSPNESLIVSASRDKTVRLWNAATGELKTTYQIRTDEVDSEGDMPFPKNAVFDPSGDLLAITVGSSIQLWSIETGKMLTALSGHTNSIDDIAFNMDGTVLGSGGFDGTIRLWGVPAN